MTKRKHPKVWVQHYRKQAGMTGDALAERLGVTRVMVGMIERSERGLTMDMAKRIADVFEIHYTDLYDGPAGLPVATTDGEKKVLEALKGMSERDQNLYVNAFLSGLNMPKPEGAKDEKKRTS